MPKTTHPSATSWHMNAQAAIQHLERAPCLEVLTLRSNKQMLTDFLSARMKRCFAGCCNCAVHVELKRQVVAIAALPAAAFCAIEGEEAREGVVSEGYASPCL